MDWTQTSQKLSDLAKQAQDRELDWFTATALVHPWTVQGIIFGVGFFLGAWLL